MTTLLLCFGLKVAIAKSVHEIEVSRKKSSYYLLLCKLYFIFLTWCDTIFSNLIIVMWINSETWIFDKIQIKMWFLLHLHVGIYYDTDLSIQLQNWYNESLFWSLCSLLQRAEFGCGDPFHVNCFLPEGQISKWSWLKGFSLENPNSTTIAVGPWWFHQCLTGSHVLLIRKDLLSCTIWGVDKWNPYCNILGKPRDPWESEVGIVLGFLSTTCP